MEYYRIYLQRELEKRCKKNPKFSLRAFARLCDVDPGLLSRVLSNKQRLGRKTSAKILDRLKTPPKQRRLFLQSLVEKIMATEGKQNPLTHKISQKNFSEISDWFHYAILELSSVGSQELTPKSVSKSIGISQIQAKIAIAKLIDLGLLQDQDGSLVKTSSKITTTNRRRTCRSLKKFHVQMLELAAKSIEKSEFNQRAAFGVTMAIDPTMLPAARSMIEDYANKLCELLESGEQKKVYQLETVLFPLERS